MPADIAQLERTLVPTLRYRDVAAAIDWLCEAFGFEKRRVVGGENGNVRYAELTFGDGMVMVGPAEDAAAHKLMTQPADIGGAETQICYLSVSNAIAHYARAKAFGAEIVLDIEDDEDGNGCGYSCRDLEGHIWSFGTHDPWERQPAPAAVSNAYSAGLRRALRRSALVVGLVVVAIASAVVVGWPLGITDAGKAAERAVNDAKEQLARERGERQAVERLARSVREQLGQERAATEMAERAAKEVQAQLAQERGEKEDAERAVKEAREQLTKGGTERALEELREQLARERSATEAARRIADEARERLALAERSADAVHEQLAAERSAREAAERATQETQQARDKLAIEPGAKKRKLVR